MRWSEHIVVAALVWIAAALPANAGWYYGPRGYTANTADFDGTGDWMRLTSSGPTGLADGKVFTFSVWFNPDTDGTLEHIFNISTSAATYRIIVQKTTGNVLQIQARNSSSTEILNALGSTTFAAASGWYHIHAYIDLANSSNRGIVINGTADASVTWTTYTDDTIQMVATNARYSVGTNGGSIPSIFLNAGLADLFFDDSYITTTATFRNASTGKPEDLGATGTSAVFFLNGSGDGFATNAGTGGNFTLTGTLGTVTPP